jgi:hypothetical protein
MPPQDTTIVAVSTDNPGGTFFGMWQNSSFGPIPAPVVNPSKEFCWIQIIVNFLALNSILERIWRWSLCSWHLYGYERFDLPRVNNNVCLLLRSQEMFWEIQDSLNFLWEIFDETNKWMHYLRVYRSWPVATGTGAVIDAFVLECFSIQKVARKRRTTD